MKITALNTLVLSLCSFLITHSAFARPEYSAMNRISCSSCHTTPWGGGPRNVYGKIFGARNLGSPKTNNTDVFYGDFRALLFTPKNPVTGSNGMAMMEIAPSANVPITESEDGSEMHVVATYDFAPIMGSGGAREAYIHWQIGSDENRLVSHVLVGRFNSPFGLLTDEHQTYTRILTNSTLNTFLTGLSVSGEPIQNLHYDLALTNNLKGDGGLHGADIKWGEVFNLRWTPEFFPGLFGASQNYQHSSMNSFSEPIAFSAYSVISLDRLTNKKLNGSLSGEVVSAKNWIDPNNNSNTPPLASFFGASAAYQTAAAASRSIGYYCQAKYDLTTRWSLFYKFDYLTFDESYPADAFMRHGLGFEVYLNSNVILNVRGERASVGRPEIVGTNALAAEDDLLATLRLWL